jgi:purine-nucleoside phosphorylase
MADSMQRIEAVRDRMVARFGAEPPRWALVLGSGVGGLTQRLAGRRAVAYRELGLPGTDVVGHAGEVAVGELEGVRVACLSGRNHLYEGHDPAESVLGLRALLLWGAQGVILTSSVGSIRPEWPPGSIVMLRDHINLSGVNPLRGPNLPALGPRFPDLCQAYTPALRKRARAAADEEGVPLHEGVYVCMPGPSYETPAEIRMLRGMGADLVGMSVVHETIVTVHAGRPLLAFCIVANPAAGLSDKLLDHEALTAAVSASVERLTRVVVGVIRD